MRRLARPGVKSACGAHLGLISLVVLDGEFVGWLGFVEDGGPFYRGKVGSNRQNKYGHSTIVRLFCYLDHRKTVCGVPEMNFLVGGKKNHLPLDNVYSQWAKKTPQAKRSDNAST